MVRLWDVATGTALQTLKVDVAIRRLSFFRGVHTMRQIEDYQIFSLSTVALFSRCNLYAKYLSKSVR